MRFVFLFFFVLASLVVLQCSAQHFLRDLPEVPEEDIFHEVMRLARAYRVRARRSDWSDPMAQLTGNSFWTYP
ncbi:hypothetical protein L596_027184 [Steinernema carpocapsae]|uniref:Uncharacterized protein n=1 Tax=Steinernema carpocapsae TaxID=34508 RepID=A0A4U5M3J9_STECR|nr:hypothetical protein L596_027184 [Steinernema carpocapsae]